MTKYILGEKLGMSQVFDQEGKITPVTVVSVNPNIVVQVKSKEKDGYEAVQLGFGNRKVKNIKKPQKGHFKDLGNFRYLREFRLDGKSHSLNRKENETISDSRFAIGAKFSVSQFQEGDMVKVSGISKSKGFQGVMKRHGFHGAPASHGTKHAHREPGSIGGGGGRAGGRVVKGMKMAGRMGGDRISVKGLKIVKVDVENGLLAISGAVPGRRGTLLEIRG